MTTPTEIHVSDDRARLVVTWPDGVATLTAADLRAACRCAFCVRDRALGLFPPSFPDAAIAMVEPVAAYAINVAFADGHDRGIFPWTYLRELRRSGTASAG